MQDDPTETNPEEAFVLGDLVSVERVPEGLVVGFEGLVARFQFGSEPSPYGLDEAAFVAIASLRVAAELARTMNAERVRLEAVLEQGDPSVDEAGVREMLKWIDRVSADIAADAGLVARDVWGEES